MPARSLWKGAIVCSMISVPVRLYTATESKDVSFNTLHAGCGARIKQQRVCPVHDNQVLETMDQQRAYQYSKDTYIEVTDNDLAELPVPSKNIIDLKQFVGAEEIDPVYFEKAYWLEPEPVGERAYALLCKALAERNLVGIGAITLRTRERLCALRVGGGTLVLSTLYYPDEIRDRSLFDTPAVTEPELNLAISLVDTLTAPFDPSEHTDAYRTALLDLITARASGGAAPAPTPKSAPEPQSDLMAMLQAAVADAKAKTVTEPKSDAIKPKRKGEAA